MTSPAADRIPPEPDGPPEPAVVRLRSAGEIVASLPALLGYHAERSIVLLMLGGVRRRVTLTMRADLPDSSTPEVWRAVSEAFLPGVVNAGGDEAVLVLLDGDEASAWALEDALADALEDEGVTIRDVLVVSSGHYRSIHCENVSCCPPEGSPVPGVGAATAAAVASGRLIRASRDDLRAEIAPPEGPAAARAETVVSLMVASATHGSLDLTAEGVEAELDSACAAIEDAELPLDQAARLALLVRVGELRDRAYLHLVTTGPATHRAVWGSVCRQLPLAHTVVPHVMFALSAYLEGEGALATVALEAAEAVDALHPSVCLLGDVMRAGIPPGDVRDALRLSMSPAH